MAKMGRPTKYTPELADEICDAIASSQDGLSKLCDQNPHWPHRANIFIWLRKYTDFRDKYTIAKQEQAQVDVDVLQELMNESHHYQDELGNERVDVHMLRVKIDTIKWKACKLLPKQYGNNDKDDKSNVDTSILEKILNGEITVNK